MLPHVYLKWQLHELQHGGVVSEPDPRKNRKEGLGDRGGSVHCARNAGALPIDS